MKESFFSESSYQLKGDARSAVSKTKLKGVAVGCPVYPFYHLYASQQPHHYSYRGSKHLIKTETAKSNCNVTGKYLT